MPCLTEWEAGVVVQFGSSSRAATAGRQQPRSGVKRVTYCAAAFYAFSVSPDFQLGTSKCPATFCEKGNTKSSCIVTSADCFAQYSESAISFLLVAKLIFWKQQRVAAMYSILRTGELTWYRATVLWKQAPPWLHNKRSRCERTRVPRWAQDFFFIPPCNSSC